MAAPGLRAELLEWRLAIESGHPEIAPRATASLQSLLADKGTGS